MNKIFYLFLIVSHSVFSQYEIEEGEYVNSKPSITSTSLIDKIYVGSGLNLNFWSGSFNFYLSPFVGYDLTEKFSIGLGTMYNYSGNQFVKISSFGVGPFMRFRPIEFLALETSYNFYRTNQVFPFYTQEKINVNSFMTGIGYIRPLSNRNYYQFFVQYDWLKDLNVPEPVFIILPNSRVYFKFSFVFYFT